MIRKIFHFSKDSESLCGIPSSSFSQSYSIVNCEKCREILNIKKSVTAHMRKIPKIRGAKNSSLPIELQNKIYTHWLCHPDNTKPEIAVRFGVTVWMVETVLNLRRKKIACEQLD